jgi:hypothetical protein
MLSLSLFGHRLQGTTPISGRANDPLKKELLMKELPNACRKMFFFAFLISKKIRLHGENISIESLRNPFLNLFLNFDWAK